MAETCSAGPVAGTGVVRRSAEAGGAKISYLATGGMRAGSAPTLLLLHGAGVSARSWTEQLRSLGHALRVLAPDLPGHGESDPVAEVSVEVYADATREFLDRLGSGRVIVGGHSLGGAVALALAARHPEAVAGLVLLATCARLPERDIPLGRLLWYLPGPIRKVVFFSMAKKLLFAPGAPKGAVCLGMEELQACRPETILRDVAAARAMNLEEAARGIGVPTLLVCGSRDKVTPPELSERLNALVPGSRLVIVEGAGHMLPLEASERISQEILDFVESAAGAEVRQPRPVGAKRRPPILRRLLGMGKACWDRTWKTS